jgi:2-oxoisovalerate dehydrogenase E1 component alpha subunit
MAASLSGVDLESEIIAMVTVRGRDTLEQLPTGWEELLPAVEPVQLLAPDGLVRPSERFRLDLDTGLIRRMHTLMCVSRRVDREAINLQRQGELALHLSCAGQEAAQVGSALAMNDGDWAFPQGRELAAAITRGLDPADLLHVWRGTWHGRHDPAAHRFGLMTMPIGTQALHAVGFAMGASLDGAGLCVVCYFGDGATSEGDVHEAMNFAAVYGAPVVFLIQNNHWAISVPVRRQTAAPTLAHKGVGYGIPAVRVDGNDVLACYAVTRSALAHARDGGGPVLIEALTYRMEGHSTSDDPGRYRPPGEQEGWRDRDPILRIERYLESEGTLDEAARRAVAKEAEDAAMRLRRAIVDAPSPEADELFAHAYVDMPESLQRQRADLRQELTGRRDQSPVTPQGS